MAITLFIFLLCLVCWLGGMIFFTIFTTPAIFATLSPSDAGKLVSAIFPKYYLLGYVAGVAAVILALYFTLSRGPRLWWSFSTLALAAALALTLYAGAGIRPRIEAIRSVNTEANPDPAKKAEFDQLHRLSVALNGGTMILNLIALLTAAAALAPRG
jgi:hypothetical protein